VAAAAVEVLESAGFQVTVPRAGLCCGRPLYDFGMLPLAKLQLQKILQALRPEIQAGTAVVGLEPSCVAVFRDELVDLFPHDEDAKRLRAQTFTLAEFLDKKALGYHPPKLKRAALVHGHCHQKAIMGMDSEEKILQEMQVDATLLDDGCCGMAGSFGFEAEKYQLSLQVGGLGVIPKVRDARKDTIVVADGFSCRTQIEHTTQRRGLHLAQVMQMALREGSQGTPGDYPERRWLKLKRNGGYGRELALVSGLLLAGAALFWRARKANR